MTIGHAKALRNPARKRRTHTIILLVIAALIAVLLTAIITPTQAHAAGYRYTSTLCTTEYTDVPVRVCTQVRYYSYGDGSHKPVSVYMYFGGGGAYDLDNFHIFNNGSWRWVGSNLGNYRVYGVSGVRTWDSRCYTDFDTDGYMWWNDTFGRHYHRCW